MVTEQWYQDCDFGFDYSNPIGSRDVQRNARELKCGDILLGTALPGFRSCKPPMSKAESETLGP